MDRNLYMTVAEVVSFNVHSVNYQVITCRNKLLKAVLRFVIILNKERNYAEYIDFGR